MEKTRADLKRHALSCSLCQGLLQDPVTLPCGHSFCKSCVEASWDRVDETNIYQCPQCRHTFSPRPLLQKTITLVQLVEELKIAGPEDVACGPGSRRKSCLVSQPHPEEPSFTRHELGHQETCSQHGEEKKMFCRTDQQVVCHLCAEDQHKDHHIVSAAAERGEREKEVDQGRGRLQQSIQGREEEVKLLQQEQRNISDSADKAVKDSQETLKQLIQNLQRSMSDVEQQIRSRQDTDAAGVRGLQEQLEQELAELKKKDAELQQLSLTKSHLVFLQNWSSLPEVSEDALSSRTPVHPHCCFEQVSAAMSVNRVRLQDFVRDAWINIKLKLAPETTTRNQFLGYSQNITLDPTTAHLLLVLSEGNRRVTNTGQVQLPAPPDRFLDFPQVLSGEPLTGRCYWEVELSGSLTDVAVSYENISRSGVESQFGFNTKSWALRCDKSGAWFLHNSLVTAVSSVRPSRVGVFLDHCAGLLCFYSVSDTMTLLHRVQTTFTQPLHAGVCVHVICEFLTLPQTGGPVRRSTWFSLLFCVHVSSVRREGWSNKRCAA
ncbi:tripartite motif-containing protein 16-like [Neosynchiropus ocellatus]